MNLDYDRFTNSSSYAANNRQRKSSKCLFGTWSVVVTGILGAFVLAGVLYVFHTDAKVSSFDELVTTGGAVRSLQVARRGLAGGIPYLQEQCLTKKCRKVSKYVQDCMNESVDPCVDFFEYSCGGWIKRNPIPKTSSTFSTFSKLNQQVEKNLKAILQHDYKEDGPILRKVKKFYKSCMNMKAINKKGKKPMMELIKYLGGWNMGKDNSWNETEWDLTTVLLKIHQQFTSSGGPLFSVHVSDDPVHNEKHILEVCIPIMISNSLSSLPCWCFV